MKPDWDAVQKSIVEQAYIIPPDSPATASERMAIVRASMVEALELLEAGISVEMAEELASERTACLVETMTKAKADRFLIETAAAVESRLFPLCVRAVARMIP